MDGPLANDTITYAYDELGRMKTMTPQEGQAVNYAYDPLLGRLSTISQGTNTFTYGYSGNSSMLSSLTRPNGSISEYQYNDPLKRLTAITNKKSSQDIINSFAFTYNNLDLIETETITNGEALDAFTASTTGYTPNSLNQTVSTTSPDRTFVYDFDGNLTEGYSADGYKLYMTYDAENRMASAQYTDNASVVHRTEYTLKKKGIGDVPNLANLSFLHLLASKESIENLHDLFPFSRRQFLNLAEAPPEAIVSEQL